VVHRPAVEDDVMVTLSVVHTTATAEPTQHSDTRTD